MSDPPVRCGGAVHSGSLRSGRGGGFGCAAQRIDATLRGVEGTNAELSALGKTLSGVKHSADRAMEALAGIADTVDGDDVLPLWQEAVDRLHEGTRGIGDRAAAMNAELDGLLMSVRAASDGLAGLPETAGILSTALSGEVEDFRRETRGLSGEMRKAAAASEFAEPAGKPTDRIRPVLAGLRRATAGLRRGLTRLAGFRRRF